jgi:hypothetical protein
MASLQSRSILRIFQELCQLEMVLVVRRSVVNNMLKESNIAGIHSTRGDEKLSWNGGCCTSAPHAHGCFSGDLDCHKGREPTLMQRHPNFVRQLEHEHTHVATTPVTWLTKSRLRQNVQRDQIILMLSGIHTACKMTGL